jgi:hypothetical protein
MKRSKHWPAKDATEMHLKGLLIRKDPVRAQIVPESIIAHQNCIWSPPDMYTVP